MQALGLWAGLVATAHVTNSDHAYYLTVYGCKAQKVDKAGFLGIFRATPKCYDPAEPFSQPAVPHWTCADLMSWRGSPFRTLRLVCRATLSWLPARV